MSNTQDVSMKHADKQKPQVTLDPAGRTTGETATLKDDYGRERSDVQAEQYPTANLRQQEKADQLNKLKLDLANEKGITPFGAIEWTDEAGKWLLRKQQAAQKASFHEWFGTMYDKSDDVHKKWARERFPNFYRGRVQALEENLDTLGQLARLRIHGVRSKEDLYLKYAAETGLIDMARLENILHPEGKTDKRREFQRGLLNPRAYMSGSSVTYGAGTNSKMFTGAAAPFAQQATQYYARSDAYNMGGPAVDALGQISAPRGRGTARANPGMFI